MNCTQRSLGVAVVMLLVLPRCAASRVERLPSLQLTHNDLWAVVTTARELVSEANQGATLDPAEESLSFRRTPGELPLELVGPFTRQDLWRCPERLYHLEYRASPGPTAPVSHVQLYLAGDYRVLEVRGTRPEQVDAVMAALRAQLLGRRTWHGSTERMSWVMLLTGGLFCWFWWRAPKASLARAGTGPRKWPRRWVMVGGLVGASGLAFFPVDAAFPGTVLAHAPEGFRHLWYQQAYLGVVLTAAFALGLRRFGGLIPRGR